MALVRGITWDLHLSQPYALSFGAHLPTIETSLVPWVGAKALKCACPAFQGSSATIRKHEANGGQESFGLTDIVVRVPWMFPDLPASNPMRVMRILSTGGLKATLWLTTAGKLRFTDSAGGSEEVGATTQVADTWVWLDVKIGTGATGAYEVRVSPMEDGGEAGTPVVELSGTGNLTTDVTDNFSLGDFDPTTDVAEYFGPGIVSNGDYRTENRVSFVPVDGAGSLAEWTTGSFADLDEALPADGDATSATSSTADQELSCALADPTTIVLADTIGLVQSTTLVRTVGGTDFVGALMVIGGTSYRTGLGYPPQSTGHLTDGYRELAGYYLLDPSDSQPWTLAKLAATEFGVFTGTGTGERRATLAGAVVVWQTQVAPEANEVTVTMAGTASALSATIVEPNAVTVTMAGGNPSLIAVVHDGPISDVNPGVTQKIRRNNFLGHRQGRRGERRMRR